MAVSAFKSTSKRQNQTTSAKQTTSDTPNPPRKFQTQRSRSVSAVPRIHTDPSPSSSSNSINDIDFLIKRDNPLFWTNNSPREETSSATAAAKFDLTAAKSGGLAASMEADKRRGRPVSRKSDVAVNQFSGRSLSRVDPGRRRRSVSRGHYGNSESEVEQECNLSSNYRNKSRIDSNSASSVAEKSSNVVKGFPDLSDQWKTMQTWSSQHPPSEPPDESASCSRMSSWEDETSTTSISEAEDKLTKANFDLNKSVKGTHLSGDATTTSEFYETVRSEVRRAISDIQIDRGSALFRNTPTPVATTDVAHIPPDLVNPRAVELVLDSRKDYATKLEQSQGKARQLRADLAVEEHRVEELSKILKEILPEPKNPNVQKPRPGRKTSLERRKMSKRLTDEAMAYFDECVSISTFDSDFSSQEDPPINLFGAPPGGPVSEILSSSQQRTCNPTPFRFNYLQESDDRDQFSPGQNDPGSIINDTSYNSTVDDFVKESTRKTHFSFAPHPTKTSRLAEDIKEYVKNFEKNTESDSGTISSRKMRSNHYEMEDYKMRVPIEKFLSDKMFAKNRTESGGLLLCGGGGSFFSFASVI